MSPTEKLTRSRRGHVHHPNKGKNEPKVADVEDTIFNTEFERKLQLNWINSGDS